MQHQQLIFEKYTFFFISTKLSVSFNHTTLSEVELFVLRPQMPSYLVCIVTFNIWVIANRKFTLNIFTEYGKKN